MTKKQLFTCDICHTDFNDKEKAIECEKGHSIPNIKECYFRPHQTQPDRITMKFVDGSEVIYTRWRTV